MHKYIFEGGELLQLFIINLQTFLKLRITIKCLLEQFKAGSFLNFWISLKLLKLQEKENEKFGLFLYFMLIIVN